MFVSLDVLDPLKKQILFVSLETLAFPNVHLHRLVALPCRLECLAFVLVQLLFDRLSWESGLPTQSTCVK